MTERKDRSKRRHLNRDEMSSMGYADMQAEADDSGWPYEDDDGEAEGRENANGRYWRNKPRTKRRPE